MRPYTATPRWLLQAPSASPSQRPTVGPTVSPSRGPTQGPSTQPTRVRSRATHILSNEYQKCLFIHINKYQWLKLLMFRKGWCGIRMTRKRIYICERFSPYT
jgi:hypothetical protein